MKFIDIFKKEDINNLVKYTLTLRCWQRFHIV